MITKTKPFLHQEEGVEFAYSKPFSAFFLEQGLGKTKMLIDLASNLYLNEKIDAVLLIGPLAVCEQWIEELGIHSPIPFEAYIYEKTGTGKAERRFLAFKTQKSALRWLITNIEGFSSTTHLSVFKEFLLENKALVAIDEVHSAKSVEAQRTQNLILGLANVTRMGRRITKVEPIAPYRVIMTGTPVANAPFDLFAPFEFLSPGFWGMPFSAFKARYGLERTDCVPGTSRLFKRRLSLKEMKLVRNLATRAGAPSAARVYGVSVEDIEYLLANPDLHAPYKNLPELKAKIAPYAFIRKKVDCLDLPPKIYTKVPVEMNSDQAAVYKKLVADLEAEYGGVTITALNALTLTMRLAQVTSGFYPGGDQNESVQSNPFILIGKSSPKIDAMLDHMREYLEVPCIVVCRFVEEARRATAAIRKAFPEYRVETVIGEVPVHERERIVADFKKGEVEVIVATQRVIGTGLNLQVASLVYFLSNSYSLIDRAQTEDRIHRPGTTAEKCTYVDFLCRGTIDERVYDILLSKKDLLEYMRGKSFSEFLGGVK